MFKLNADTKPPPDRTAGVWPTPQQRRLLQAAVLPPTQALAQWRQWCQEVDLEKDPIDRTSFQLLPLVHTNLAPTGERYPYRLRLQGIWRRAWAEVQVYRQTCSPVLVALQHAQIPFLLLPGDLAIRSGRRNDNTDLSIGSLGKFEVLIQRENLATVTTTLAEIDWQLSSRPFRRWCETVLVAPAFCDFVDVKRQPIRLRWRLFDRPWAQQNEVLCWTAPYTIPIADLQATTLALKDHLLYLIFAVCTWTPIPRQEWIARMALSLPTSVAAWRQLVEQTQALELSRFAHAVLAYLCIHLNMPIPAAVLETLEHTPCSQQERHYFQFQTGRSPTSNPLEKLWWFIQRRALYPTLPQERQLFP